MIFSLGLEEKPEHANSALALFWKMSLDNRAA